MTRAYSSAIAAISHPSRITRTRFSFFYVLFVCLADTIWACTRSADGSTYRVELGAPDQVIEALSNLVMAINQTADAAFLKQFAAQFDVDRYMRAMVVEWLISNPDSYSWRGNNWYDCCCCALSFCERS